MCSYDVRKHPSQCIDRWVFRHFSVCFSTFFRHHQSTNPKCGGTKSKHTEITNDTDDKIIHSRSRFYLFFVPFYLCPKDLVFFFLCVRLFQCKVFAFLIIILCVAIYIICRCHSICFFSFIVVCALHLFFALKIKHKIN